MVLMIPNEVESAMAMSWAKKLITMVAILASSLAVLPAVVRADDFDQDNVIAAIVAIGGKVERTEGGIRIDLRGRPRTNPHCQSVPHFDVTLPRLRLMV